MLHRLLIAAVSMSFIAVYTCDGDVIVSINDARNDVQCLLDSRTDSKNPAGVLSASLDKKKINDAGFKVILTAAINIQILSIQHNILSKPEPVLHGNLRELDLCHGTIQEFSLGQWATLMPHLAILKLAHNKITSIASGNDVWKDKVKAWNSTSLQELYLNNNDLTTLDFNILNNAPNLQKAHFEYNKIDAIISIKPYMINKRKKCTVFLHGNTVQDIATPWNTYPTDEALENRSTGSFGGLAIVTSSAVGIGVIVVYELFISSLPMAAIVGGTVSVPIIILGGMCGGIALGGTIAQCCMPEDLYTYKPFILNFEAPGKKDNNNSKIDDDLL